MTDDVEGRMQRVDASLAKQLSAAMATNGELLKAAGNAAATIAAFYEWFDRVEKAGGATSISGVASCNAMLNSMRKNRKRTFELVIAPVQAAIAKAEGRG